MLKHIENQPLLIAPEGIEMCLRFFRLSFAQPLLIAPEGIEIPFC